MRIRTASRQDAETAKESQIEEGTYSTTEHTACPRAEPAPDLIGGGGDDREETQRTDDGGRQAGGGRPQAGG